MLNKILILCVRHADIFKFTGRMYLKINIKINIWSLFCVRVWRRKHKNCQLSNLRIKLCNCHESSHYFVFPLQVLFLDGMTKFRQSSCGFVWSGVFPLDTWANCCDYLLKFFMFDYDMPSILEINNNGWSKRVHVGSFPSIIKSVICLLPQYLCSPNVAGWWRTTRASHP